MSDYRVIEEPIVWRRSRSVAFTPEPPPDKPEPVRRPAKVAQQLALAHHLQAAIERGLVADQAALARKLGLTRARIAQLFDLLMLAANLQGQVLALEAVDGAEPMAERTLRAVAHAGTWAEQRAAWQRSPRALRRRHDHGRAPHRRLRGPHAGRAPRAADGAGVTLLADVRQNPISRKKGLSKSALALACAALGIRYEHQPELGIASEKRKNVATQADLDALFAEYERDRLPTQGAALAKLLAWVDAGERVALTCFERAPGDCHRHCVAEALAIANSPPWSQCTSELRPLLSAPVPRPKPPFGGNAADHGCVLPGPHPNPYSGNGWKPLSSASRGPERMSDEILTVQEVAALLKVADKTVYTMAQKGEIPAFKVRGQWRFRRADIDTWIQEQTAARRDDGGADE